MTALELWGQGVLLASLGLPLLWLLARAEDTEPASRHRRLVLVLVCSNALLLAPQLWARIPGVGGKPAEVLQAMVTSAPAQPSVVTRLSPLSVLALCWLGVSALALLRTGVDAWRLRRAIVEALPAAEADCIRALQLARKLSLPTPRLLVSARVAVPCAASAWRPAILLPSGLRARLSDEAFDCVLGHELCHLDRADQAWALLVALLRVPFALHPVTRKVVAGISLAREEAVDALVARADAHTYASALVEVAAQASTSPGFPEAVFMGAHALSKRVEMLTNPRPLRRARFFPLLAVSLLLGALAMTASPAAAAAKSGNLGTIKLTVGSQKVLTVPGLTRHAIGDPAVADARTIGLSTHVLLKGVSPGQTKLRVWGTGHEGASYSVVVE